MLEYSLKRINKEGRRFVKGLRLFISALVAISLAVGLLWYTYGKQAKLERTEFLFDTQCTVTVYGKNGDVALDAAFAEMARLHRLTDFFDENSDVSRINRAKGGEAVKVDIAVIEIIDAAKRIAKDSEGAFDITIAPISRLWRFDDGEPKPPDDEAVKNALSYVGREQPETDLKNMTVTKSFEETKIDLGGAVKGYAGDAVAEVLKGYGVESAVIDLGGNITCFGKNPSSRDGKWRIGLQKPFAVLGEYDEIAETEGGAVVTSGTYQRYFEYGGELFHHIIDPKTGYPVRCDYESVTVKAQNTLLADCLATAIFVAGRDKGASLAEKYGAELYFK